MEDESGRGYCFCGRMIAGQAAQFSAYYCASLPSFCEAEPPRGEPNVFDMTRDELLNFLPDADTRWLRGALLALYDALSE